MNFIFDKLMKQPNNKILCMAKNYLKHAKEMSSDVPKYPVLFQKPWSNLVWEPNPIKLREHEGHSIEHESKLNINLVELGIVIGKEAKSINKDNYLDYIECYFICLDLTDRTFQTSILFYNIRAQK